MTQDITAQVASELSEDIRPQDDFYRYVNGKWLETAEIPADQASAGSFITLRNEAEENVHQLIQQLSQEFPAHDVGDSTDPETIAADKPAAEKISDLYHAFMDVARINATGDATALAPDLDLIRAASTKDELASVVGTLYAHGVGGPFGADINANRNDPLNYIPYLYQSGLGLPDESFYREPEYAEILAAYQDFVPRLYALATEVDDSLATTAAENILAVEQAIAKHHFTVVELRDVDKTNTVLSWADFLASAPGFDWEAAFTSLGLTAQKAPEFLVMTPRALAGFAQVWQETELGKLRDYLTWHVILARAPFLSENTALANFSFYGKTLNGQPEQRDRWKRGVAFVNAAMGEAVGEAYVAQHFPPYHKEKMQQLVADLLAAYQQSITDLDWMTEATKAKALTKLSQFVPKIGYPDQWRDYSKLATTPHDLLANVRSTSGFETDHEIAKLGNPVDRTEWFMYPQTVNAYYNPVANEIVFPAAILQPPFFQADADPAWNYGGIGAVIGHEIGHGFDDQGSKYDGLGRLQNWWTDTDRAEFEARTKALVAQYDGKIPAQLPPDSPYGVNGELTLGENIGDLGGLTIALKAYDIALKRAGLAGIDDAPVIAGFTGAQRVFLSYARIWQSLARPEALIQQLATDPHSPAEFRCNGIVRNIDAFAEAFELTEGDAMYLPPEERVRIW
ncbi:MAG: M13-type metalloendopeptidase [Trueperella sp.]|nr:M13-type metalloendopeptidase [Trueperella sp.]